MDIQVSSNFERLLWEASGRDGLAVAGLLEAFRSNAHVEVPASWTASIRAEFEGGRLDDEGTLLEMAHLHEHLGLFVDPHTAVGTRVARDRRRSADVPMITLATAHPAKFPDAVERATGVRPPLPTFLSELFDRPEHLIEAENSLDAIRSILQSR